MVAMGAAVQAGVLSGDVKDVLLLDVTPLSLAIETQGGVSTVLIPRNTTIPTRKSEMFSTAADSQPSVEIHVTQGERNFSKDNRTLGRFVLDGIPPAPRGIPQIEVAFDIDANGILSVKATDKATGKEQHITITTSSGLSDEDIDKMVKDAEANEEEDKKRREFIDIRNQVEFAVYNARKLLDENKDKLDEAVMSPMEKAADDAEELLKANEDATSMDVDGLKNALTSLEQATHKFTEALYQHASTSNGASAGPSADDASPSR